MTEQQWFYCLNHHKVEPPEGCRAIDRLGPYPDPETAARALEIARQRTEEADRWDREFWDGDETDENEDTANDDEENREQNAGKS